MRLVVQGDTIAMYIDGYDPVFATDFTYAGGHIFLAVGSAIRKRGVHLKINMALAVTKQFQEILQKKRSMKTGSGKTAR